MVGATVPLDADAAVTALYAAHYRGLVRLDRLEQDRLVAALRGLPARQRECLVLRYYGDLSEAQIAAAMGISTGAVKSHASRGMAALRATLEAAP